MNENFLFLKSTRFWAVVIAAVSLYLQQKGYIGDAEMLMIATITAGFTTIRTVDRISDKKVEVAEIAAGTSCDDEIVLA